MATMEERLKILQMVQEGKLTAEDASALLEALDTGSPEKMEMPPAAEPTVLGRKPRWLRVRVTDMVSGRPRVNVRLPISMVSLGIKMGSKFSPEVEGLDTNELMQMINAGEIGQIVDVVDEDDHEHVEVFLE